jgi:hypothetical protein
LLSIASGRLVAATMTTGARAFGGLDGFGDHGEDQALLKADKKLVCKR